MSETKRDSEDAGFTAWPVQAIGPERSYTIESQTWTVREVVDPVTVTCVLIFTSVGIGRRVRRYPTNWRDLSSPELQTLSWST